MLRCQLRFSTYVTIGRRVDELRWLGGAAVRGGVGVSSSCSAATAGVLKSTVVRQQCGKATSPSPCLPFFKSITALHQLQQQPCEKTPNASVVKALEVVIGSLRSSSPSALRDDTLAAIERTIPYLRDNDDRGKQQALMIFAFLYDGEQHMGHMAAMSKALSNTSSAAAFNRLMAHLAPSGSKAEIYLEQAVKSGLYNAQLLEAALPKEHTDVVTFLGHRRLLLNSNIFGGTQYSIWTLRQLSGKFDRHIAIGTLLCDQTVARIQDITLHNRVALVYGESGSGKTVSSILSAGEKGLCIYLTPDVLVANTSQWTSVKKTICTEAEAHRRWAAKKKRTLLPPNANSTFLMTTLRALIETEISDQVSLKEFKENVVLVVDEVGEHPELVRALCREGSAIVAQLKTLLNLTGNVGIVVSGTGCEMGAVALGSYPDSYRTVACVHTQFTEHVVDQMVKRGLWTLAVMLSKAPINPALMDGFRSYYRGITIMDNDGKTGGLELQSSARYVRQLMKNRRFAASLLKHLSASFATSAFGDNPTGTLKGGVAGQRDASVPWLTLLPCLTSTALLEFKSLNGLSALSFDELRGLFAEALALCFGGYRQQGSNRMVELHRNYGIVVDNARVVKTHLAEFALEAIPSSSSCVVGLPREPTDGSGYHLGRRFEIGPAAVEMGLQGFALSTTTRARSGDGLEDTIADFMYCWALACCTDVLITLLGEINGKIEAVRLSQDRDSNDKGSRKALLDVMRLMRNTLRLNSTKVVLKTRLTKQVTTVADAVTEATQEAWNLVREEGVPFVMIVHNAPMAPFADVFVVAGKTCQNPSRKAVNHTLFVAIQTKHYTTSKLSLWESLEEHCKSGCTILLPHITNKANKSSARYHKIKKEVTKAFDAKSNKGTSFLSLVLVVHNDEHQYDAGNPSNESFAGMTTVWIRSSALRSVLHPISLDSDRSLICDSCTDSEMTDLRPRWTIIETFEV